LDRDKKLAGLLEATRQVLEQSAETWTAELKRISAVQSQESFDLICLIRGLLEALQKNPAPASVWPELRILANDLLRGKFQVELVREPKQPVEWFDEAIEADIPAPRVERVGLALRAAEQEWFCFPKGRMLVPLPRPRGPRDEASEAIVQLVASADYLKELIPLAEDMLQLAQSPDEMIDSEPVLAFLDQLVTIQPSPERVETLGAILDQLRHWCAPSEILPRGWTYRQPINVDSLPPNEQTSQLQFDPNVPPGQIVRIQQFGLAHGEVVLRTPEITVSAGPPPAGHAELAEFVAQPDLLGGNALQQRIDSWPEAALHGTLEMVAVQFFVDFWGALGEHLRAGDPESAQELNNRLLSLLRHEWKLYPFHPVAYQDHPDGWLQRVAGRNMVTGRVRRILRPGLQDEEGHLRVPALVEVD
jgi:hypothetical protein